VEAIFHDQLQYLFAVIPRLLVDFTHPKFTVRNIGENIRRSKQQEITAMNAKLLIEAVCEQPEPATCIQRLIGSAHGFLALQSAL
jgi:hypothetical protein